MLSSSLKHVSVLGDDGHKGSKAKERTSERVKDSIRLYWYIGIGFGFGILKHIL